MALPEESNSGFNYVLGLDWESPTPNPGTQSNYLALGVCFSENGFQSSRSTQGEEVSCGTLITPGRQTSSLTVTAIEDPDTTCNIAGMLEHAYKTNRTIYWLRWNGINGGRRRWGRAVVTSVSEAGTREAARTTYTLTVQGDYGEWSRDFSPTDCDLHPNAV